MVEPALRLRSDFLVRFDSDLAKAMVLPFLSPWAPTLGFDDGALGAVNYTVF